MVGFEEMEVNMDRRNFLTAVAVSPLAFPLNSWGSIRDSGFELPHVTNLEELQLAVDKCFCYLTKKHNGTMGPPARVTEKGTPYVTCVIGGLKKEGETQKISTKDANKALHQWFEHLDRQGRNGGKSIVWRMYPEVRRDHNSNHYMVRSRVAFE